MTSLRVCVVRTCPTMTFSASALCLHRRMTLARHTPSCQRHTAERSVHRRRCRMDPSSPSGWCQSVADVLWRWIAWLSRTRHRQRRPRHATESCRAHHLYSKFPQTTRALRSTSPNSAATPASPHLGRCLQSKPSRLRRWAICFARVCFILFIFLVISFCQTNYLNIYQTDLHEICRFGRTLAVGERSEVSFSILQEKLPHRSSPNTQVW